MLTSIEPVQACGLQVPRVALREIDINVTNFCNLECVYCSYSSTRDSNEPRIPAKAMHRLLDEAAAMGVRVVHFSGGEPVTRADMPEFISHGVRLGFKMRMHSNGALLKRRKLEQLWQAGLRQVLVSLDGDADEHDFHRAEPGLYAQTLRGIEAAASMGYNVRINAVGTTRNVHLLPSLVELASRMGAATFSVFYLIPVGRGRDVADLMVPPARWRQFIAEMRQAAARDARPGMDVTVEKVFAWLDEEVSDVEGGGRGAGCLGFLRKCDYVNVLADGRVLPCICFADVGPALGNIFDRPLADILHDPASWEFYYRMNSPGKTCSQCNELAHCGGGSRPMSRLFKGDYFALDPRCNGNPRMQGYIPICFMCREDVATGGRSGFAEKVE